MIVTYLPYTSVTQLVFSILLTVAIYLFAQYLRKIEWSTFTSEITQSKVRRAIEVFLLIFEPLAVLVLVAIFVGLKPMVFGPLVIVVILVAFNHLRNYLSRSIVLIDNRISNQSYIHTNQVNGNVSKLGRLSMELQSEEGVHVISYLSLLDHGYTISEGDKVSRLYTLKLKPIDENSKINHEDRIIDKLANTPYIDWSTAPTIGWASTSEKLFSLRVVLRDRSYIDEVVTLLTEWGYDIVNR